MNDLANAPENTVPIVAVLVGSESDLSKIAPCVEAIQSTGIPVVSQAMSAHRRPEAVAEFGQNLPEVTLPEDAVTYVLGATRLKAACVIAAAGCSAHIAGALAAHTVTPVIALPVSSSAGGTVDSTLSMIDMPPGIPNGFVPTNAIAAAMATKLFNLKLPEGYHGVAVSDTARAYIDDAFLAKLGLVIDEKSPIMIGTQDIDFSQGSDGVSSDRIHIIIPTSSQQLKNGNTGSLDKINQEGFYMPLQRAGKVNTTNAVLFAAQILGSHNPEIRDNLIAQRAENEAKLVTGNRALVFRDVPRLVAQQKVTQSGLWPANKTMNLSRGDEVLESLGYVRFYTGKNADLYVIPDTEPLQILQIRTDRTSVLNIPLDLEVEGKGAIQNQISLLGAKFAEKQGINTMVRNLPEDIPAELRDRCQAIELGRQVEVEVNGKKEGMELIYRNYITGTLLKLMQGKTKFQLRLKEFLDTCPWSESLSILRREGDIVLQKNDAKEFVIPEAHTRYFDFPDSHISKHQLDEFFEATKNPYQLDLPSDLQEWGDLRDAEGNARFTPTDKTKADNPIPSHIVETVYPKIVKKLGKLFKEFTQFALEAGYVLVDTKFEVFMNSEGEWAIGDEILTPESSRFIKVEDFKAGRYISADKQYIRELAKRFGWEEKWGELLRSDPKASFLPVSQDIAPEDKATVIAGYTHIFDALSQAA